MFENSKLALVALSYTLFLAFQPGVWKPSHTSQTAREHCATSHDSLI